MVEDYAFQPAGDSGEPARSEAIGGAWPRISARMRMTETDSGASAARRIFDNRADGQGDVDLVALVTGEENAVQSFVEMGDEQALSSRVGLSEATGEELASRCKSA